jgi:hypothetical protein
LATFTGTKAKTARGAHLKARRKLEGAYHEALEAYQDKNEASDSNAEAKVPEKK